MFVVEKMRIQNLNPAPISDLYILLTKTYRSGGMQ